MSVKYFNKEKNKWQIFPGTVGAPGLSAYQTAIKLGFQGTEAEWIESLHGKSAYEIAVEGGFQGTEAEYNIILGIVPSVVEKVNNPDTTPTNDSDSLITSGGVKDALDTLKNNIDLEITNNIVDNLTSSEINKSLSARQGKVLKSLIDAIKSFSIVVLQDNEELPEVGESHTVYLKKKKELQNDVYSEYLYIDGKWEIVGTTDVDLSNYYTKDQVYNRNEIDDKFSDPLLGNVVAVNNFTTEGRIVISAGSDKTVKDSGILLENMALKSYVDEKEIPWNKITNTPETYAPSKHTHVVSEITDFPEIPSLDGYATEEWVNSQGFKTTDTNTWRPIKSGDNTLNDNSTPLTITAGTGINVALLEGTLTITNSAPGSSYSLPTASDSVKGGIKLGYIENSNNIPLKLSEEKAFITITSSSIIAALGYTPANSSNIPSIPSSLPNPKALNITANGSSNSYIGNTEVTINLDNIYTKKIGTTSTPGAPGICVKTESTTYNISSVTVTEDRPDAVLVVPANAIVNITDSKCKKADGIDDLSGTQDEYKCYAFTYINSNLVLVNCALYK